VSACGTYAAGVSDLPRATHPQSRDLKKPPIAFRRQQRDAVGTQSCRMGLFSLQDIVSRSLYTLAWHQIGPVRYLPMNTSETNAVSLTPISTIVHPRFYAAVLRYGLEVGHSRSQPAGLESTFNPASAKPVAPTEKPLELTGITPALEPAREPVPGAIPG
jgi:hypothetical protein